MKKLLWVKTALASSFWALLSMVFPSNGFCIPTTYEVSGHMVNYWLDAAETTDPNVQAERDAFAAGLSGLIWAGATFNGTLIFDNALSVASWDPNYIYMGYSYKVLWESGLAFEVTNYPWQGGGLIDQMSATPQTATEIWDGFLEGGHITTSGAADDGYNTSTTCEHALHLYGSTGLSTLHDGMLGADQGYYGPFEKFGYWLEFDSISPVAPIPEPTTILLLGTALAGLAGSRMRNRRTTKRAQLS